MPTIPRLAFIAALLTLGACAATHPPRPVEMIDERSGSTLMVVARPLIFARERTDVAANARDYATLVAVEIDDAGRYSDYLLLYRWSTVDPRMSPAPDPERGEVHILADGRDIAMSPLPQIPIGLSKRRELHLPAHAQVVAYAYTADGATLRYLAASSRLLLRLPQERLDTPFTLWQDGRRALEAFLER